MRLLRRDHQVILMGLALILLALGGLVLVLAKETERVVRRFSGPAIESASDLRRAVDDQPVILQGRIDPRTPTRAWDFAIYVPERLETTKRSSRYADSNGPSVWVRTQPAHRPPFVLATNEGPIPIINGHYAIERPSTGHELGRFRCSGFRPGDDVLVIGKSAHGGVAAGTVFGGTREEFQKGLQGILIRPGRIFGGLSMGLGVLVMAVWAAFRFKRPPRGARLPS
jgi:hypothetical protein